MIKLKSLKMIIAFSLMFASFGQIASDLYLPSLPNIVADLQTKRELVQLTVTCFMISYCIARLFYGPLSDGIGRKRPLIIGFSLAVAGSFICLIANSIYLLMLGRLIQGFGAAAGSVLTAAILRDLLEGRKLARVNSYFAFINIIFVASPPLLGGYLEVFYGWRSAFLVLLIYTIIILIVVFFAFPETNLNADKSHISFKGITHNIKTLMSNKLFICYTLLVMSGYAVVMAWLTSGPIIVQNELNYSPVQFGWFALYGGLMYCAGALINAKIIMKSKSESLIMFGSISIFIAGLLFMIVDLIGILNIFVVLLPVFIFSFGNSFIFPSSYAGAMTPFPKQAGSASAVLSSMQILGGVLGSGFVAILPFDSITKLGVIVLVCGIILISITTLATDKKQK